MDWKEYEDVTKYIYETLGKNSGVKILCHGNKCKVIGKSGVEHQVDVLTSHSDGLHSYKTMIECKYWETNVNKDIVMKVSEVIEDASLNKGVIVSKNGFTPDATSFAKHKNIGLVELREPTNDDTDGSLKEIFVSATIIAPEKFNYVFLTDSNVAKDVLDSLPDVSLIFIRQNNGEEQSMEKYLNDFIENLSKIHKDGRASKNYLFENGAVVISDNLIDKFQISGIQINCKINSSTSNFLLEGKNHIYLILKSLFENKSFSILKDGQIKER